MPYALPCVQGTRFVSAVSEHWHEVRIRAAEACVARAAALDAVALAAVVAGCKAQEDDDLLRGLGQEAWPGIADAVEAEASLEDAMASAQAALPVIKKQEWVKRRAAARILGEAIAERGAGSVNVVPLKDRMKDEEIGASDKGSQ